MKRISSFTDLRTWQKAYSLAVETYKTTEIFSKSAIFDLTYQFRKAALSIPANITQVSPEESRYCILLSKDLNCIQVD